MSMQPEWETESGIRPWGMWESVALTAGVFILYSLLQALSLRFYFAITGTAPPAPGALAENGFYLSLATLASAPLGILLIYILSSVRGNTFSGYNGLRSVKFSALLRWILLGAVIIIISDMLTLILGRPIVPGFMTGIFKTARNFPLFFLAVVIAAPVFEEFLFRGFFLSGLRRTELGEEGAVFLTSITWALVHRQYDAYGIVTVFVIGIFLGAARVRTNSLYTPIAMHVFINLAALIQTAIYLR